MILIYTLKWKCSLLILSERYGECFDDIHDDLFIFVLVVLLFYFIHSVTTNR